MSIIKSVVLHEKELDEWKDQVNNFSIAEFDSTYAKHFFIHSAMVIMPSVNYLALACNVFSILYLKNFVSVNTSFRSSSICI